MAKGKHKLGGMGGSRCGRSRQERTETLKHESNRIRREQDKQESEEDKGE